MHTETLNYIAILLIMLIEPISWHIFCYRIQKQLSVAPKKRFLYLLCFLLFILIDNLLTNLLHNYSTLSYLIDSIAVPLYYFYATKLFHIDSKITICFISILNLSFKMLENIYTFILMIALRVVSPDYALEPNLFRVFSFAILYISVGVLLLVMSNMKPSHIVLFKGRNVCNVFTLLLFIDLISFFIFSLLTHNHVYEIYDYGTFITVVCETVLSLYAIHNICTCVKNQKEMKFNLDQATSNITLLEQQKLCSDNARKVVHDSKNHLCTIGFFLENKMYDEALQYVKELAPELKSAQFGTPSNDVLITMLFRKKLEAKRLGVSFEFWVAVKDVKIPLVDTSTIIFNMSDNAIRYCSENDLGEYGAMYRIYVYEHELIFECFNMIKDMPLVDEYGQFVTSKPDKENHGLGMRIMDECVKKYNGSIKTQVYMDQFTISAHFNSDLAIPYDDEDEDDDLSFRNNELTDS